MADQHEQRPPFAVEVMGGALAELGMLGYLQPTELGQKLFERFEEEGQDQQVIEAEPKLPGPNGDGAGTT